MDEIAKLDSALDEALVNLGAMVLAWRTRPSRGRPPGGGRWLCPSIDTRSAPTIPATRACSA